MTPNATNLPVHIRRGIGSPRHPIHYEYRVGDAGYDFRVPPEIGHEGLRAIVADLDAQAARAPTQVAPFTGFRLGTRVRKIKGSSWQGRVVGYYTTALTVDGYCVESEREPGSVQLYPRAALELVPESVPLPSPPVTNPVP